MTALRSFVYLLVEPDQILASEQQSLAALDQSLNRAHSVGADRVLVHVGFERLADEEARILLASAGKGLWLTAAAAAVAPSGWQTEARVLPAQPLAGAGSVDLPDLVARPAKGRPGRKEDPNSARFKAREIYKAHWQEKPDREIKRLMTTELGIDERVANTYFIDFRKEMGHVSKRQQAKSVEFQSGPT